MKRYIIIDMCKTKKKNLDLISLFTGTKRRLSVSFSVFMCGKFYCIIIKFIIIQQIFKDSILIFIPRLEYTQR